MAAETKTTKHQGTVNLIRFTEKGNFIIETDNGMIFYQDFDEQFGSKQKVAQLYRSLHIGDIIEYKRIGINKCIIRNITQEKIDALINNPRQDAVVLDYYYIDNNCRTYIRCWTPVWKEIEFNTSDHIPLRYNDVITIEKLESGRYYVVENKTLTEEKEKVIKNKLLAGFTDAEVNRVLCASNGR